MDIPKPIIERFWTKVEKSPDPDGCWLWTASQKNGGYGQCAGITTNQMRAHRFSYLLHFGEIPEGMCVLHRCDVRLCVNPAHLFLGTRTENQKDMAAKGRSASGQRNGMAKLTQEIADSIRCRHKDGETAVSLAREFSVTVTPIYDIIKGKRWVRE